ncbi:MAG: hypothetical protein Ct9H300mP4_04830 [Gammaproteobacteria bacterium]|nr:MAG: hypothetical protein Ct9H300mP4_04830 [Gammaproteobacteria bacterium]
MRREYDNGQAILLTHKPIKGPDWSMIFTQMVHVDEEEFFSVACIPMGFFLTNNNEIKIVCHLPAYTHNPRLWKDGVFLMTPPGLVPFVPREGQEQAYKIITYEEKDIQFSGIDDSNIARQGFGRGL